jgi:hypothetical protein
MPCKEKRDRRLAKGICANCGRRELAPGITRCYVCQEKHVKDKNIQYNRRKDSGLCLKCSMPLHEEADEGYLTCMNCRQNLHTQQLYKETNIEINL